MPKFETAENLQAQTEIADAVLAKNKDRYDGYIFLSPFVYRLDGCFYKTHGFGYKAPKLFFEAKTSNHPFDYAQRPRGYEISVGKLMAARWLKDISGLDSALFVRFDDGTIAGIDLAKHREEFTISGRAPRPDSPYDIEPMAIYPWDRFKIVVPGRKAA